SGVRGSARRGRAGALRRPRAACDGARGGVRRVRAAARIRGCDRDQPGARTPVARLRLRALAASARTRSGAPQPRARGARARGRAARARLGRRLDDRLRDAHRGRALRRARHRRRAAREDRLVIRALLVSNALLWLAVVTLAGVVLALMRQIGVLHERVAPAGALATGAGPRAGEPAPALELDDWSGRRVAIGGARADGRSTLLFFLSPGCPVCKTLLPVVLAIADSEARRLRVVLASDGPREEHAALVAAHRLDARELVLSTQLALAYRVGQLPFAVLIDAQGRARAAGLVNTREHLES